MATTRYTIGVIIDLALGRLALLLYGALASALGCTNDGTAGRPSVGDKEAVTTEAITATASTAQKSITIASTPNAECLLRSSNPKNAQTMPVWADDTGIIHLWGPQTSTSETYALNCKENGITVQHAIDLADAATFLPAKPSAAPPRKILPALSDPTSPSQAALIAAGYPPRPNPGTPAYAKWLEIVSAPATLVPQHPVTMPDLQFGLSFGPNNWAGLELDAANTRYVVALSGFPVPPMGVSASNSAASFWSGLGGDGEALIQDGVLYRSVFNIGWYIPWYEYWKDTSSVPVFNSNFVINPNDNMVEFAWEGDSTCTIGPGHTGYGCFWYQDQTHQNETFQSLPVKAPAGSVFNGTTAEGIVESQSGFLFPPWTSAPMQFLAYDPYGGTHDFATDPFKNNTMVDGSENVMARAQYSFSPDYLAFTWVASQ